MEEWWPQPLFFRALSPSYGQFRQLLQEYFLLTSQPSPLHFLVLKSCHQGITKDTKAQPLFRAWPPRQNQDPRRKPTECFFFYRRIRPAPPPRPRRSALWNHWGLEFLWRLALGFWSFASYNPLIYLVLFADIH